VRQGPHRTPKNARHAYCGALKLGRK